MTVSKRTDNETEQLNGTRIDGRITNKNSLYESVVSVSGNVTVEKHVKLPGIEATGTIAGKNGERYDITIRNGSIKACELHAGTVHAQKVYADILDAEIGEDVLIVSYKQLMR